MNYNKSNKGLRAIAVFLAIVLVLAAVVGVVAYFSDWFTDWSKFQPEQQEEQLPENEDGEETAGGGLIIGESEGSGISLMSVKIMAADYEEYGISPMAETAYQLTATITPEEAVDKTVYWSVSFVNPSSVWATGKTVTDYVTVTPTSDGALTATVSCLQDFGEQITVTVTSRDNAEASASCLFDYAKRVEDITYYFELSTGGKDYAIPMGADSVTISYGARFFSFDVEYSDYTIDDEFTFSRTFTVTGTAEQELQSEYSYSFGASAWGFSKTFNSFHFVMSNTYWTPVAVRSWLLDNSGIGLFTFSYSYTGEYSNYSSGEIAVNFDVDTIDIPVSDVSLDESSLIF